MEGQFSSSKADGLLAIWPLGKQPPSSTLSSLFHWRLSTPLCLPLPSLGHPPRGDFSILALGGFTPTSCETARTAKVKRQIAINGERVQLQRAIFHPLDPRRHVPPRATLGTIPATTCLAIGRTTCLCFLDSQIWIPIQGLPIWPVHHPSPLIIFPNRGIQV